MTPRRYLAFDIETAKLLPPDVSELHAHRPLGIACAAAFALDSGEVSTWHGVTAAGSPAPQLSREEAAALVADLQRHVDDGYTLVTWNGLSFDFDILAEESGAREACAALAVAHVDMMFHVVCTKGHFLGLQTAASGMGLDGKLSGVSGADAPQLWADGEFEKVLAYCVQDVRATAELAAAGDQARELRWKSKRGKSASLALPDGWATVTAALQIPEPDTSWMSNPPQRDGFLGWTRS